MSEGKSCARHALLLGRWSLFSWSVDCLRSGRSLFCYWRVFGCFVCCWRCSCCCRLFLLALLLGTSTTLFAFALALGD
jgi:hypothetical protein